jgi:hypothetical protein
VSRARSGTATTAIGGTQQQHRERERIVEHQALAVPAAVTAIADRRTAWGTSQQSLASADRVLETLDRVSEIIIGPDFEAAVLVEPSKGRSRDGLHVTAASERVPATAQLDDRLGHRGEIIVHGRQHRLRALGLVNGDCGACGALADHREQSLGGAHIAH